MRSYCLVKLLEKSSASCKTMMERTCALMTYKLFCKTQQQLSSLLDVLEVEKIINKVNNNYCSFQKIYFRFTNLIIVRSLNGSNCNSLALNECQVKIKKVKIGTDSTNDSLYIDSRSNEALLLKTFSTQTLMLHRIHNPQPIVVSKCGIQT